MMMRFQGGGVGHTSTCEAIDWFLKDRDKLDMASEMADEGSDENGEGLKTRTMKLKDGLRGMV